MDAQTQEILLNLNRDFYNTYAQSFSATRQKIQPGVSKLLSCLPLDAHLLDLGCGNGNFALALAEHEFNGTYLGLDGSPTFIREAALALSAFDSVASFHFHQADLTSDHWLQELSVSRFDIISAFAVLHHLPGEALHTRLFGQVSQLLRTGGWFFLSTWQIQNNPRLYSHILPWDQLPIIQEELSPNDFLMDWRAEGAKSAIGRRYVHLFTPEELHNLGKFAGLELQDEFFSDGKQGNLSFYQVWQKPS